MRRNRQVMISAMVVGLGLTLGTTQSRGQGSDTAVKDRVAQLVERLNSPKAETAAAAEKSLIDLGERGLPFLPTGGPNVAKLDAIRQTIREQAEANTNLGASLVTLQAKGMRLTEALRAIQTQTGNIINDLREAYGEEATNPALDLDLTDRPFYEALDIVAEKAGVKITPYTGDGTIGLMNGGMMDAVATMPARPKPMVIYSGPFRIELKQLAITRDFTLPAPTASAQFEVLWEPRLRPMLLGVKNEDLAITDDQGRAIAPQVQEESGETALRAGNCAAEVNLALASPDRSATKLASLKVKGTVTVPSGMKMFKFPTLTARNVSQKQGDITVTLENTEVDEQIWKVGLIVAYPGSGPEFASYRQGLFNNRLWLQKPDGSRFEQNGGYNNTGSDNARVGLRVPVRRRPRQTRRPRPGLRNPEQDRPDPARIRVQGRAIALSLHAQGKITTRRPSIRSLPAAKSAIASGKASHSASKTRAARDSGVSLARTGTGSWKMIGPVS